MNLIILIPRDGVTVQPHTMLPLIRQTINAIKVEDDTANTIKHVWLPQFRLAMTEPERDPSLTGLHLNDALYLSDCY